MIRVGVDTGGTFTDVVAADGTVVKLPSTPDDPARAVAEGLDRVGGTDELAHGTTVATNALLERRGGRVALVATAGHRDVIEIARQARPSLYDVFADRPEPLVERDLRFEVEGRLDGEGKELVPLGAPPQIPAEVDAAAVALLHADLNPAHEQMLATKIAVDDLVCSHQVSPEFRDYERTVTTVVNAYLLRPCRRYLAALAPLAPEVVVMTSAGGLVALDEAAALPVALLLSGPAGGVLAAAAAGAAAGWPDCVTFDMGGTSTDVCLIAGAEPAPAAERQVGGFPIRMPSLDVHTIGAGGGSIAYLDAGGALAVGPASAGAVPGPACYGRGGTQPTVTDADVAAGRMPAVGLPGIGLLSVDAARSALSAAGTSAEGVIAVVNEAMVQAVRVVSVQRGIDPRDLALVAFGGAGPMHACALADALGMPAVVVPPRAGVLSAAGILAAPRQRNLVRSWPTPGDHRGVEDALAALAASAEAGLGVGPEVTVTTALDCRYAGQSHELRVPEVAAFPVEHRQRNGFTIDDGDIEVVALRATARRPSPVRLDDLPPIGRHGQHRGPVAIAEEDCTIWVAEGWVADAHPSGSWVLTRS